MHAFLRYFSILCFTVIMMGCQHNDDPLYAPWNTPEKPANNADITAIAGNIATGHAPHAAYHDMYANSPKECVTNPNNMNTVCTLVDPN